MNKIVSLAALAAITLGSAAAAHDTTTPFSTRGECESASAKMSQEDKERLLATQPQLFDTMGEVSSFLTRAWSCELSSDGQWYIKDHRRAVLNSDWFQRRNR